ncbi:hypothetical protein YM304_39520 [Ilumatobacter coccineus YM16-304]|uniref:VOC domain-containing protein n=1 Tax=Ilumatobacter coccineus (strain NBRC 103263 / KCTC 29153 / YM16-304) TaxID=1313172 RepID=A0A6C7EJY7_ILUCY|nr:hypothetical protein YM304_39520 [Ilumatobacter coccineus YM16-304]
MSRDTPDTRAPFGGSSVVVFGPLANLLVRNQRTPTINVRLVEQGVEFTTPTDAGPSIIAVFDDTCGNLIQIVQMKWTDQTTPLIGPAWPLGRGSVVVEVVPCREWIGEVGPAREPGFDLVDGQHARVE